MKNKKFLCLCILLLSGLWSATLQGADKDVILGDFNDGTYQGWTVEGNAFGDRPTAGKIGEQRDIQGHKTKGLVNTFMDGDNDIGTLTSPEFTVEHKFIKFLYGGAGPKGKAYIELLVDGSSVQKVLGDTGRQLKPTIFDLRDLQGKKAQVRIVDRSGDVFGHVMADEFILTQEFPEGVRVPIHRTLKAKGRYLQIPIDNTIIEGLPKSPTFSVRLGDTLLYKGNGYLADSPDKVHWWSHLDISEAVGSKDELTLEYHAGIHSKALDMITTGDDFKTLAPLYEEDLRPQLRFSQRFGWNNDPNGMQYYEGEYHLFFQSNPFGIKWANMFWGHAVSKDLIHWEERPHALRPHGNKDGKGTHPSMSMGMCFSGGGAVDFNNTLGLQKGDTKTMFVTFTAQNGEGERLAYSTDKGRHWMVKPGSLFHHKGRDPKPFWHEPSQHWVIVIYNYQEDRGGHNLSFYTSKDLEKWEYQSRVLGFFECPEFFQLPIDPPSPKGSGATSGDEKKPSTGLRAGKKWVLMGADGGYLIGDFDGKTFTSDSGPIQSYEEGKNALKRCIDGKDFFPKGQTKIYAGQCFSNTPDGRVIYIAWAGMGRPDKSSAFHHSFTVPIHLTLKSSPDGPRLNAYPIKEFNQLRNGTLLSEKGKTLAKQGDVLSVDTPDREYDVIVKLSSPQKDGKAVLRLGETEIPLDTSTTTEIRVICDRPFMEVITNRGENYRLINRSDRGKPYNSISLEHSEGTIEVEEFTVYKMKSIWKK